MASPNFATMEANTLNSLTHPLISQKIADIITGKIPFLYLMNKVGHKETENGGLEYRFSIYKEQFGATFYSGATTLTPVSRDRVSSVVLYRKYLSNDITLLGTDLCKNSGDDPTAAIDYITAQIEMAAEDMKNTLASSSLGLFSAQADSDLGITGLQTMLPDSTTTGTYGGLDRATYEYWRHQSDTVATGFNTDGLHSMRLLQLSCVRGDEAPTVIITNQTTYANLDRFLTGTISYDQPSPKTQFGDIGFEHINFKGSIVIFDAGVPANRAYFLNLKYLKLLVYEKRDMTIRDFITPTDGDWITGRLFWAGNLVCNNLPRQGLLQGLPDTWA